jgi:hypothetical protein
MVNMAAITLFHGTQTDNIEVLEPRERYYPGTDTAPRPAIYATDVPAYASAHAFPWATAEGVDLHFEENRVVLEVPKALEERLNKPIFIYTVPGDTFQAVIEDTMGHNFRSTERVRCLAKTRFETVTEAVTSYGGTVIIKPN